MAMATMLAAGACGAGRTTSVTVFAAASLTEPFSDLQARLKTSNPGLALTFSFAGSGALVTQVQQGAPADVIATADPASMNKLRVAGLVDPPTSFATNRLEILVEPGNPKDIRGLQDLSRNDIKLVVADENVPAGRYSAQALQAAGVTVRPVSKEADGKAAVAKVTAGEADATIVYVTDVRAAGSKGQGVTIPEGVNVVSALHTVGAALLADLEHELDEDVLVTGDSREAKAAVAELIGRIPGLRPVDCGRLETARLVEGLTPLLISVNARHKVHAGIKLTGLPEQLW